MLSGNSSDEIARAIESQQLCEIERALEYKINGDLTDKISPFKIYCAATGQPIGTIATNVLHDLIRYHGPERAQKLLHTLNISARHPLWVHVADMTADNNYNRLLDNLCQTYPHAACAYFIGIICEKTRDNKNDNNAINNRADYHWSLARAFSIISHMENPGKLLEALHLLAAYMPLDLIIKTINRGRLLPHTLAELGVYGNLITTIEHIITQHKNRTENWIDAINGPGHIANTEAIRLHQTRIKEQNDKERRAEREKNQADKEMSKLHTNLNKVGISNEIFNTLASLAKSAKSAKSDKPRFVRTEISLNDEEQSLLNAFQNFDISSIPKPMKSFGDAGDDIVEMRRIPRAAIETTIPVPMTEKPHRFIRAENATKTPSFLKTENVQAHTQTHTQTQTTTPTSQKSHRFVRSANATKQPHAIINANKKRK